ncbi:MAG: carbohydrate ABC transporter permease [Anaerolineae bacterium]|nr:carbohydrate ABC transporter permease [Anaerolineae bacterium]
MIRREAQAEPSYKALSWFQVGGLIVVLGAGALIMVLPFLWMFSSACKPPAEINKLPVTWLPQEVACQTNLDDLYDQSPRFSEYMVNTAIMTVGRLVGQFITCSLAAYGFARFKFPGRNLLFAASLGLLMVPFQAIMIPEYLLMRAISWTNTFFALIVPGSFSAFAMFLLRQSFMQIPREIEEAAEIDGANPLKILWYVVLPLSGPALAAFAVITVQAAWNDFLWPLVTASQNPRVVTIGIALLQGERKTPWNIIMMGSLLATLPMIILFILLQRYFIEGISMSGLKG